MLKQLDIKGGTVRWASEPVANKLLLGLTGAGAGATINGISVGVQLAIIDLNNSQPVPNFNPVFSSTILGFESIGSKVIIYGVFDTITYKGNVLTSVGGIVLFDPTTLEFSKVQSLFINPGAPNQIRRAKYYPARNKVYFCGSFIVKTSPTANEITGIGVLDFDGTNLTLTDEVLPDWQNVPSPGQKINVSDIAMDSVNGVLYTTLYKTQVQPVGSGYGATFDVSDPDLLQRRPWHLDIHPSSIWNIWYNDGDVYVSFNFDFVPKPSWSTSGIGIYFTKLSTCATGNCLPVPDSSMDIRLGSLITWPRVEHVYFSGDNIFLAGYFRSARVNATAVGIQYSGFICYNKASDKITSDHIEMINTSSFGQYYTTMGSFSKIIEHDNKIHGFGPFGSINYSSKIGHVIFNKNNGTNAPLLTLPLIVQ